MLTGEEQYVVVKLTNGEQLMAILEYESKETVELVYPMLLRTFPVISEGEAKEHITATPYSQFAENAHISINKSNVLFIKNLHHRLIANFERLIEENENTAAFNKEKESELYWEDEEEFAATVREEAESMTIEELTEKISKLEEISKQNTTEDKIRELLLKNIIRGNDTIH